jgi:prolyl-tRNA synthetase
VIDPWVAGLPVGVTGANRTDYHVRNVVPGRDFPLDGQGVTIADIRNAARGDTLDGKELTFSRGIEVGHVFKLGTKYSELLGATVLDENGSARPCLMGCYGIGINRILASAIESEHDDNGMILPISIAPFEVEVIPLNLDSQEVGEASRAIYDRLRQAGVDVLLDDREARPGVKFKDADLIGIPLRVVVGDRGLKEGKVEVKRRTDAKPALVAVDEAFDRVMAIREEMHAALRP